MAEDHVVHKAHGERVVVEGLEKSLQEYVEELARLAVSSDHMNVVM